MPGEGKQLAFPSFLLPPEHSARPGAEQLPVLPPLSEPPPQGCGTQPLPLTFNAERRKPALLCWGDMQILGGPWKGLAILALGAADRRPVWSPRQPVRAGRPGKARVLASSLLEGAVTKDHAPGAVKQQRCTVSLCWGLGTKIAASRGRREGVWGRGSFFASPGSDGCWQSLAYTCVPTGSALVTGHSPPCLCPHCLLLQTRAFWVKACPKPA